MNKSVYSPLLFLWKSKSIFVGQLEDTIDVSSGTSTLMVGLDKPIRFSTQQMVDSIECRSLLIPAGTKVSIDTQGAFLFNYTLGPVGEELATISNLMTKNCANMYYQLMDEEQHISSFLTLCMPPLDTNKILDTVNSFIEKARSVELESLDESCHFERPSYIDDTRINAVIEKIHCSDTHNTSLVELARLVNLSPAYLSELFKNRTGLPIRRYRLWYRLHHAVTLVGQGKNFTDAAIFSGFNDSSHFIRTYRSMLGMSPSSILSQTKPMKLLVANQTTNRIPFVSKPVETNL